MGADHRGRRLTAGCYLLAAEQCWAGRRSERPGASHAASATPVVSWRAFPSHSSDRTPAIETKSDRPRKEDRGEDTPFHPHTRSDCVARVGSLDRTGDDRARRRRRICRREELEPDVGGEVAERVRAVAATHEPVQEAGFPSEAGRPSSAGRPRRGARSRPLARDQLRKGLVSARALLVYGSSSLHFRRPPRQGPGPVAIRTPGRLLRGPACRRA